MYPLQLVPKDRNGYLSTVKTPEREALTLQGQAGRIEALLETPREFRTENVAVVCHPHPLHQGTMHNKVVHTLCRSMNLLGLPAIRFNFRGVGASEGNHAGGLGETEDVLEVVAWAAGRFPRTGIWLAGFSFGSMVACRAASRLDPGRLVMVAPPAIRLGHLMDIQPSCPWLVVQGDADEVVDCEEVTEWINGLDPGPELTVLPGVGHFFHGRLTQLRDLLVRRLPEMDREAC